MSIISQIRRQLGVKLFLSYLVVIVVGMAVLASAAEFAVPTAFERHLSAMTAMMGGAARSMEIDLFTNFRAAVTEALILALLAALVVALVVSFFVSRQIVTPVQQMMDASQRIAEGYYHERVYLPADLRQDQMDELSRLALSFNQMATQLEQTEETRRELIGNVAHELRTPLSTIKGSMEGLIDGVLPAEPATFQQIYREADRLQRLVADLQELSQVESGAFTLRRKPISVADLIAATVARLGRQFEEKNVALKCEIGDDLPPVLADEDRIGQVLLNLVGNALQYTLSGGQVQISAQRQAGMMQLMIADTGIGIKSEHLPHLFTRFYRVDKSRSRAGGGSGIGLTIAKHLVEAHSGRVWAESKGEGQGSTFGFSLPLATKDDPYKKVAEMMLDAEKTDRTRTHYNRIAPLYDMLEILPERRFVSWRRQLWAQISSERVLEVGVGTGKNFPYHPPDVTITGIDLSEGMLARARRKAQVLGRKLDLRQMDVQQLQFPDDTFDVAVATFVFCSVPDAELGLRELSRVVKPTGHIFLLEHVRVDRPVIGSLMDLLNPLVVRLYGANINRRTVENVQRSGLVIESVTDLGPLNIVKLIVARPDGVGG